DQVLIGERRDLREMSDDEYLRRPGQPRQPTPHFDSSFTPHASVDLVEHERRDRVGTGEHDLDGEHETGQLAARGALVQGSRLSTALATDQVRDRVAAVWTQRRLPRTGRTGATRADPYLDPGVAHRRGDQFGADCLEETFRGGGPCASEGSGPFGQSGVE